MGARGAGFGPPSPRPRGPGGLKPAVGTLVLASLLVPPARAEVPVGPPPWSCHVAAACDAEGCAALPGTFARVRIEAGDDPATLRLDGRTVALRASREEAAAAIGSDAEYVPKKGEVDGAKKKKR